MLLSAVTSVPPEAAKQVAFVVWAQAAPGSGTKGGKRGTNPLRAGRRFPTAAHLLPGSGEPGGAAAQRQGGGKASKAAPE